MRSEDNPTQPPNELERLKGWETLGPRSRKDDLGSMVNAIKAVGEAEVGGATVDVDHVSGSQHGIEEGVDVDGRLIVVEHTPINDLIDASVDREAWKEQGAPSRVKLFFRKLLEQMPVLSKLLRPMRRKSTNTKHEYVLRSDGYKRIHKL